MEQFLELRLEPLWESSSEQCQGWVTSMAGQGQHQQTIMAFCSILDGKVQVPE